LDDPPLRMVSHEERVEVGRRICARILQTFKENVLAVFITGSTAKKLDRPFSDLEMTAIVKDSQELATKYYVYDGLLIQIDYRQESEFLKSAREPGRDWPVGADECRNRIVLFERDGWTARLDEAVKENDAADFLDPIRFAALGMTESLAAVRNANFKDDLVDLRTRAFYMAWDTARVVYLLNRKYVLTTSWYWKQLFECPEQPRELKPLVEIVAGFVNSNRHELVEASERLWKQTMLLVTRRGISIESSEILV
jgi:predicted nucleotidyltransferase